MIGLQIEEYCHECPFFNPEVVKTYSNDTIYSMNVFCKEYARCKLIHKYLEGKMKNDMSEV